MSIFLLIFNSLLSLSEMSYASSQSNTQNSIGCVHQELCRIVTKSLNIDLNKTQNLVTIVGDPHEYEPNPSEVKNLVSIPLLITGPLEMNPWARNINYQRSKNPLLKTLMLTLSPEEYALYKSNNREALSHFWLYPKLYCLLFEKVQTLALKNQISFKATDPKSCQKEAIDIELELKKTIAGIHVPIILTHDALLPLIKNFDQQNLKVMGIKGSGHHQEADVQSIKYLYDALKSPRVIWIEEKNIKIPFNIQNKKRANDIIITIDTSHNMEAHTFSVLKELNDKLKAIK